MGKTSSAVKRKYNEKTYKRWSADIKNEKFEIIEKLREEMRMSRAGFLQFLADKCIDDNKIL